VTRARVVLVSPGDNRAPRGDSESDRVVGPGYVGLAGRDPASTGTRGGRGVEFSGPVVLVSSGETGKGDIGGSSGPRTRLERICEGSTLNPPKRWLNVESSHVRTSAHPLGVSARPSLPHYPTEGQIDPTGTNSPP
jgi:hypothetical protein